MLKTFTIAAAVLVTAPAMAGDHVWSIGDNQMHVVASGADVSTPAGRAALLKLVRSAATRLCRKEPLRVDQLACIDTAMANAAAASPRTSLALALAEQNGIVVAAR